MNVKERLTHEIMAMRAIREFNDGDCVNLGYGIPNLCAGFIPPDKDIIFHAEQGVLGYGRLLMESEWEKVDFDYVDAGIRPFEPRPGMCWFDMDLSFDMIRGGHLDVTVLGALEVSEKGDLANWTRLKTSGAGIGGGMDLAVGAKRVIVLMEHTTKNGDFRIVKKCRLPLTAKECVDLIITDISVIEVKNNGLVLKEHAPGWTVEDIQALTEPRLIVADDLCEITL
jgi:3-oxoacid CoA-transferase subunit B